MPTIIESKLKDYNKKFEKIFSYFLASVDIEFYYVLDNNGKILEICIDKIHGIPLAGGIVFPADEEKYYNYLILSKQRAIDKLKDAYNIIPINDKIKFLLFIKSKLNQYHPVFEVINGSKKTSTEDYYEFINQCFVITKKNMIYDDDEFVWLCYKSKTKNNYNSIVQQIHFFAKLFNEVYEKLKEEIISSIDNYIKENELNFNLPQSFNNKSELHNSENSTKIYNINEKTRFIPYTENAIKSIKQEELLIKEEQKRKQSEIDRKECLKIYIDKDYNYSPNIDDFKEELNIQKLIKNLQEYLLFLRETKKVYGNAFHYYTIYGNTGIDKSELYKSFLDLIENEMKKSFEGLTPQQTDIQLKTNNDIKKLEEKIEDVKAEEEAVKNLVLNDKKRKTKTPIDTSFNCTLSDDNLKVIHTDFIDKQIIHSQTMLNHFSFIFRNLKIAEITNPVRWILKPKNGQMNKKALIDFIRILAKYEFIPKEEGSTKVKTKDGCMFEKIELCFRDKNGEKFTLNEANATGDSEYHVNFEKLIKPFHDEK